MGDKQYNLDMIDEFEKLNQYNKKVFERIMERVFNCCHYYSDEQVDRIMKLIEINKNNLEEIYGKIIG